MEDNNSFSTGGTDAAFTVVSPNYLAHAWSLKKSFLAHNPDKLFFICVLGDKNFFPLDDVNGVLFSADIKDNRIKGIISKYNPFELSCALKPYFAFHVLEQNSGIQRLIYLDSDMYVFGSFNELSSAAITLSVHRTQKISYLPQEENYSIISLNRYGVYNAGYFELQRKQEAFLFLEWWKMLLEKYAFSKPDEHLFTDQLWLNLVHSYFDDVYINKNPGYNVAFWNLIEREIQTKNGSFWVNGEPLVLFHFSKYRQEKPAEMVDYTHPYLTFERHPVVKPIFDIYWNGVQQEGYEKFKTLPYPFLFSKPVQRHSIWKRLFRKW